MKNKVPLTVETIRKETLNSFECFRAICKKNNYKYCVAFGTMLGAIRHKGFIPWDDDFDIFMPRKDYESFIAFCINNKEEIYPYEIISYQTNKKYPFAIARFNNKKFQSKDLIVKEKFSYGLGIAFDIYPLDGINEKDHRQIRRLKFLRALYDVKINVNFNKSGSFLKRFCKCVLKFFSFFIRIDKINKSINRLASKYSMESTKYCGDICWDPRYRFESKWFFELIPCAFENTEVFVPSGYDYFLKYVYKDYMKFPPIEKRRGYHFAEVFLANDVDNEK